MFEKCNECRRKIDCQLKKHCSGCIMKEWCDLLKNPGVKNVCEDMRSREKPFFSFTGNIICKRNETAFHPKKESHLCIYEKR